MILRPIEITDEKDILEIYANPNVTYPAGFHPTTSPKEVITILKNNYFDLAIVQDNKVIGIIGVDYIEEGVGMLGFLLNEHYWHQGFGYQACLLYIKKLQKLNFHTLYADCFIDNIASQKLLLKLGFEYQNDYLRSFSGYKYPMICHLYKKEI